MQALPGRDRQYAPLNERLSEVMRLVPEGRLPSTQAFDLAFDTVEILLALNFARPREPQGRYWALPGRYGYRHQDRDRLLAKLRADVGSAAAPGPLAMSRLIGLTVEECETNLNSFVPFVQSLRWF